MKKPFTTAISVFILIATIYYSFYSLLPNKTSTTQTPLTEFSTERALVHLKKISQKPHYVGTKEHTKVKNYLISELKKLGLIVEEQQQIALNKKWRSGVKAQNIIAKINGSNPNNKALMLLTHYDSAVHSALGASDAGSGVVTILEGIRAFLATNPNPKNDIIILFSDAEEVGLLGANAFVKHHPLAKNIGLVLNFEARGSGGPSYMLLETNAGNKKLIEAFNNAEPNFPVANSLMYSIYKALPNDTDLTVFREDGNINGFNFAFIDDHYDYHTVQDSYQRLDLNTLEQQGDYLMTLLPYFVNADLNNLNDEADNIYFSFPKLGLITYPFSWVLGLFIFAALLFFGITALGIQKNKLTSKGMFAGFIPFTLSLVIGFIITQVCWLFIKFIHPQYNDILHGFTYNGHLYIVAFSAITLGTSLYIYRKYLIQYSAENLLVAPLFIWGIINLLILIYLKGAGFFIFPVYIGLVTLAILLFTKNKMRILIITILAIPTLIVFAPLVKMFPVGLGLKMLVVSAIFIVLILGLLIPLFHHYKYTKKLSYLFLLIGIITLINASFKSNYSKEKKQPTSLVYLIDLDKSKAYYASYEAKVNEYNKAYLGEKPEIGSFDKSTSASKYNSRFKLHTLANVYPIKEPIINKLKDTIIQNNRNIRIQIIPQRGTNRIELIVKDSLNFHSFKVNGESLRKEKDGTILFNTSKYKSLLSYYFTEENEVLDVEFTIPKNENPSFTIYDTKYDLFTNKFLNIKPRNNEKMMSTPFVINDATILKKEIKL